MRFDILDMNRPFEAQGIGPSSVSAVYAVNTLHVAHDLDFTLGQILRTLRPGGWLIVSECVRPYPLQAIYAEFIFNLIQTFRSPRLHPVYRPNGGFLTPDQWKGAIESAGFTDTRFVPDVMRIRQKVPDFFASAIGAIRRTELGRGDEQETHRNPDRWGRRARPESGHPRGDGSRAP
jgi:SAM-dependent methyltransferase